MIQYFFLSFCSRLLLPFSMICLTYLGTLCYNSTVEMDLYTSVSRFTTIVLNIKLNNYNYNRRRHR